MPTSIALLDETQYGRINNGLGDFILQSFRDDIHIVLTELKPSRNNTSHHTLGGDDAILQLISTDTNIWVRPTSPNCSLIVTETQSSIVIPASVAQGFQAITTAGTRVNLADNVAKSITIKANANNNGTVYIGDSTVTSSDGFPLRAGDTLSLDISNTNKIWIDASISGESISWISND